MPTLNGRITIKEQRTRHELLNLCIDLAKVTEKIVDAVENRGSIAYDSPEYDKLVDTSTDLQCAILSWVQWDQATPQERLLKSGRKAR